MTVSFRKSTQNLETQFKKVLRICFCHKKEMHKPPLCVTPTKPLLNFSCRLAPLPSFLWVGIYWIDSHLQIFPAMIFPLSVSSLHICFLSQMVVVLIPNTSQPYGRLTHPVGKSYASIVDDEKTAFLGGMNTKTRYHHHSCFCRYGRVAGIMEKTTWFSKAIYL